MRVIQDSEDEDDLELEAAGNGAPNDKDASFKHSDPSPPSGERGTGSTESLKRAIEAAHRAHFQTEVGASPTPAVQQEAFHSSVTLPTPISKRRKTSTDAAPYKFPAGGPARTKAPVTYGRSKTSFGSPLLEQTEEDTNEKDTSHKTEKTWSLQGTMQAAFAQQEPLAMFPEPSSTVPNATATPQRRLLEEVLAPEFLGLRPDPDAPAWQPAKSSVPWSDFLKSPSGNTEDKPDPSNQSQVPSDQRGDSSQKLTGGATLEPALAAVQTTQQSQRSRRSSFTHLEGSQFRKEAIRGVVNPKDIMGPPPIISPETPNEGAVVHCATPSGTDRSSLSKRRAAEEICKSPHRQKNGQEEPVPAARTIKAKEKSSSVRKPDDDLAAIGLPKEQYKPRPSRSRSLKLNEDPIDYSIRPEKVTKGPRRSKTTGGADEATTATTPQKVRQICDMGFTPSTTQRALRQNNGDITQTVDWLIANGVAGEDELAPPRPSKSKGKTKKVSTHPDAPGQHMEATEEAPASEKGGRRVSFSVLAEADVGLAIMSADAPADAVAENTMATAPERKSPSVKVVIPSREQATALRVKEQQPAGMSIASQKRGSVEAARSKAKRRKTTLDQPESTLEGHQMGTPEPPKEKKRGRGRPRKEAKSVESILAEQDEAAPQSKTIHTKAVLQEIQPNVSPIIETSITKKANDQTDAPVAAVEEVLASTPPPKPTTASTEPLRTPDNKTKAANASHSPLSKGKVPYRVGLSKRARIAPLLRTLKK